MNDYSEMSTAELECLEEQGDQHAIDELDLRTDLVAQGWRPVGYFD